MKTGRNAPCPCGSGEKYKKCCLPRVRSIPGTVVMARGGLRTILGVQVWEQSKETQMQVREDVRQHLITAFSPGTYRNSTAIVAIVDRLFSFYDGMLKAEVTRIASWSVLDFVLYQIDCWTQVYRKSRQQSSVSEQTRSEIAVMRRALKHVAEVMCAARPQVHGPGLAEPGVFQSLERVFIAAELMLKLATARDRSYKLFPENTTATVFGQGHDLYLELTPDPPQAQMQARLVEEIQRYFSLANGRYSGCVSTEVTEVHNLCKRFEEPFQHDLGFSPTTFINTFAALLNGVAPHPNSWGSPFVTRSQLIDALSCDMRLPKAVTEGMLEIFTLDPSKLEVFRPDLWRIKREDRVSRKPLLRVPHRSGDNLAWSPEMLVEAAMNLFADLPKRRLPRELQACPLIKAMAEEVHQAANREFEHSVLAELTSRGFIGHPGVKNGSLFLEDRKRLEVPAEVGELDLLCIHPQERILLVGECKHVAFAPEPAQWYEDLQDFVLRSGKQKAYRSKFLKKIHWASENAPVIVRALCREAGIDPSGPWTVEPIMITYYPTLASQLISEFPCISVFLFLEAYDREQRWPTEISAASTRADEPTRIVEVHER